MKKLILLFLVGLISCGPDPGPSFLYTYQVTNNAGFEIRMTCATCETVTIKDGETKEVKTNEFFYGYDFAATSTTARKINLEETSTDAYKITSFEFDVQYKITGTAATVDVTLENASGGTSQFSDVPLPATYQYKDYNSDFVYISAQNNGQTGSVTVEILHRDKPFKSSTSSGAFVVATASGSI